MKIEPLPVFEADADPDNRDVMTDQEIYERLEPPKTLVVRFGCMKLVGEFVNGDDLKPGCGSKLVARTPRGTEVVEMLTTTCENAGCGKSVTRNEMLDYISASGGKDYPFFKNGRVIRIATIEDLNKQSALQNEKPKYTQFCKKLIDEYDHPMKLVDVEPILGGELLTFYYMAEQRIDFRELVKQLAAEFSTRIEMRQVGARDEARLVADYERCGQHCCCKSFLKVLKPVSMRAAKMQKATLDPLKISGRCGRLMCCLRYEDQTYRELKQNLPNRKTLVGTSEGPGIVMDSKILVQLVLVKLESDNREIAVPVEELMPPDECPTPEEIARRKAKEDPFRGMDAEQVEARIKPDKGGGEARGRRSRGGEQARDRGADREKGGEGDGDGRRKRRRRRRSKGEQQDKFREASQKLEGTTPDERTGEAKKAEKPGGGRRRRGRGRSKGSGPKDPAAMQGGQGQGQSQQGGGGEASGDDASRKKRRRRRRGRGGGGGGGGGGDGPAPSEG